MSEPDAARRLELVHAEALDPGAMTAARWEVMSPEERRDWWLANEADDAVLACRGATRHGFDRFRRDRDMPNTWAVEVHVPGQQGVYTIVQRCPECELVIRAGLTGPHGVIGHPFKWRYWWDPRYKARKGAARVWPRDALGEATRRMNDAGWIAAKAAEEAPAAVLAAVLVDFA